MENIKYSIKLKGRSQTSNIRVQLKMRLKRGYLKTTQHESVTSHLEIRRERLVMMKKIVVFPMIYQYWGTIYTHTCTKSTGVHYIQENREKKIC